MSGFFLYKITSPLSDGFYFGITGVSLDSRMRTHVRQCFHKRHKMALWLRKYHASAVIAPVACGLSKTEAQDAEFFAIQFYLHKDERLQNSAPGGRSNCLGVKRSAETREKIRQVRLGKKRKPETVEKMRAAATGRTHDQASRNKQSKKLFGQKRTEDTRAKISNARKGMKFSDEHRAKIAAAYRRPVSLRLVDPSGDYVFFENIKSALEFLGVRASSMKELVKHAERRGYKVIAACKNAEG